MIIDVSHHNGIIDWKKLNAAGVDNAFIKCTNGAFNKDDQYSINISQATVNGINTGSYHFMLSGQDPDLQAENFLQQRNPKDTLKPVLDIEWDFKNNFDRWKNVPHNARIAMIGRFLTKIKETIGILPIIYTNAYWWGLMIGIGTNSYNGVVFSDCPLWLADYTNSLDNTLRTFYWPKFTLRQYTEKGTINGISGFVDLTRLNGDISEIKV